jgi:hypothetical protein
MKGIKEPLFFFFLSFLLYLSFFPFSKTKEEEEGKKKTPHPFILYKFRKENQRTRE